VAELAPKEKKIWAVAEGRIIELIREELPAIMSVMLTSVPIKGLNR
jgi:hypothetical protein